MEMDQWYQERIHTKKQYKSLTNIWEYAKPINKMKMNISETEKS